MRMPAALTRTLAALAVAAIGRPSPGRRPRPRRDVGRRQARRAGATSAWRCTSSSRRGPRYGFEAGGWCRSAAFFGYSVGRWQGDVFVVETRGFNDKTPLDVMGHPHSEDLKVTERFRRRDFGHLDVEMTFEDDRMYTKPFTVRVSHTLIPDADIFEMFCENEKDREHIQNGRAQQPAAAR